MSRTGITVTAWEPIQRIVTLDIFGRITQADVPVEVITQDQWTTYLQGIAQPVVDSMIQQETYDPNLLMQIVDLSQMVLTQAEIDLLIKLKVMPALPPA